jgi:hypothetical protein
MKRHLLCTGALAAAVVVTTGSAARADATPTGIELGLRTGYAIPLGSSVGGPGDNSLSNTFNGVLPIWVDAGYRLNPNLFLGAYFQYGIAFLNTSKAGSSGVNCNASGVSCSGSDLMFGVQAHYHFMPDGTIDPWAGLGIGYEIANVSVSQGGQSASVSQSGFQFVNFQAGGDYKATPNLGIGPFVMFSLGQYGSCSFGGAASSLGNCSIQQTAMHEWLTFGVRGVYDINL